MARMDDEEFDAGEDEEYDEEDEEAEAIYEIEWDDDDDAGEDCSDDRTIRPNAQFLSRLLSQLERSNARIENAPPEVKTTAVQPRADDERKREGAAEIRRIAMACGLTVDILNEPPARVRVAKPLAVGKHGGGEGRGAGQAQAAARSASGTGKLFSIALDRSLGRLSVAKSGEKRKPEAAEAAVSQAESQASALECPKAGASTPHVSQARHAPVLEEERRCNPPQPKKRRLGAGAFARAMGDVRRSAGVSVAEPEKLKGAEAFEAAEASGAAVATEAAEAELVGRAGAAEAGASSGAEELAVSPSARTHRIRVVARKRRTGAGAVARRKLLRRKSGSKKA